MIAVVVHVLMAVRVAVIIVAMAGVFQKADPPGRCQAEN